MTAVHDEIDEVAARFGVAPAQVWRDHLISHMLGAIARTVSTDEVIFFGGTALSRTHLPDVRLSEYIDLIAVAPRSDVVVGIERAARLLGRSHGNVDFVPPLARTTGSRPSVLRASGLQVQVQLIRHEGYPAWPTEVTEIRQRYSDAPPARLRVPTAPAFAAAKLSAWLDRRTSRDLYDMSALADHLLITKEAFELFTRSSSFARLPGPWAWTNLPSEKRWRSDLAHQVRLTSTPEDAARKAQAAWADAARA